jgi:hypothetical protein
MAAAGIAKRIVTATPFVLAGELTATSPSSAEANSVQVPKSGVVSLSPTFAGRFHAAAG